MASRLKQVEFLVTGDVTWTSRSGKSQVRKRIKKGDKIALRVTDSPDSPGNLELWDGNWSIVMSPDDVRIV